MGTEIRQRRIEFFWANVERGTDDECWVWQRKLTTGGYGQLRGFEGAISAHRFAYELLVGSVPTGRHLDHVCRNRACVNPAHLEPVTPRENLHRGETLNAVNVAKTRCPHGHPYDDENTYRFGPQRRYRGCKECRRAVNRRLRAAKAVA